MDAEHSCEVEYRLWKSWGLDPVEHQVHSERLGSTARVRGVLGLQVGVSLLMGG